MKEIKSWHDTFYTHLISKGITTKKAAHTQDVTVAIKKKSLFYFPITYVIQKELHKKLRNIFLRPYVALTGANTVDCSKRFPQTFGFEVLEQKLCCGNWQC